jgi:hypothetical protein
MAYAPFERGSYSIPWKPGNFSSSLFSDISNRELCCRFGVFNPSGTSALGAVWRRSNAFCWCLGGMRSPGMDSVAPGGGGCYKHRVDQYDFC